MNFLQRAPDLRPYLHPIDRRELTKEADLRVDIAHQRRTDGNLRRRRADARCTFAGFVPKLESRPRQPNPEL